MSSRTAIIWFRQDLRLHDNPALHAAVKEGYAILPLYIYEDAAPWPIAGAQRWWLHHSLQSLSESLIHYNTPLILRRGEATSMLPAIINESGASAIFWNRCYEPHAIARDTALKEKLTASGISVHSFNGALLFEPWEVQNKSGSFFKVFTPFWKQCLAQAHSITAPLPAPKKITPALHSIKSDALDAWNLLPTRPNWAKGFAEHWQVSEHAAHDVLDNFIAKGLAHYKTGRDHPSHQHTSRLSPYLHMGQISPRQLWQRIHLAEEMHGAGKFGVANLAHFLSEIGWREFSHHLLYHVPHMPESAFNPAFNHFPWHEDEAALRAWQRGRTGYPIVDAGMRELWHTGMMHNRVRMIVASFLTKHLLIPWQQGAAWFWDTLLDADLANNSAGWQWVAGSGADAAPYFRIFNPVLQGEKFDADGAYVRHWVPELAALPDKYIHQPWNAPSTVMQDAGISLGSTYPHPIIEASKGRDRALTAYQQMKQHSV